MSERDDDIDENALSDLYTEFSREEPSTDLDNRILSEARKAVAGETATPKKARGPFSGQWTVPMSLAAVIVLSVIVVTAIEHKHFESLTSLPKKQIVPTESRSKTDLHDLSPSEVVVAPSEKAEVDAAAKRSASGEEKHAAVIDQQQHAAKAKKQASPDIKTESLPSGPSKKPALQAPQRKQVEPAVEALAAPPAETGAGARSKPSPGMFKQSAAVVASKQPVVEEKEKAPPKMKAEQPAPLAKSVPETLQQTPSDSEQTMDQSVAQAPADIANSKRKAVEIAPSAVSADTVAESLASASAAAPNEKASSNEAKSTQAGASMEMMVESTAATDQVASQASVAKLAKAPPEAEPTPLQDEDSSVASSVTLQAETTERQENETGNAATKSLATAPQGGDTQLRSLAVQPDRPAETDCGRLSETACYQSSSCILQWQKQQSSYICRAADNVCEKGFSQSDGNEQDCESKPGCVYVPAVCYCAPNVKCVCGGGPPAMCKPENLP